MRIELSNGLGVSLKVLKYLKRNKTLKSIKGCIVIGTFTNCRECGLTFMYSEKKSFTWCVYEHRNSDSIIINGKSGYISMADDLPYCSDSKWDYLGEFSYNEHSKCADSLAHMIMDFHSKIKFDEKK
jgi:hypothetical protein